MSFLCRGTEALNVKRCPDIKVFYLFAYVQITSKLEDSMGNSIKC